MLNFSNVMLSSRSRLSIIFLLISIVLIIINMSILIFVNKNIITQVDKENSDVFLESKAQYFKENTLIKNDNVKALRESWILKKYLDNKTDIESFTDVQKLFMHDVKANLNIYQATLIDENGREILKVRRNNQNYPILIEEDKLNKNSNNYDQYISKEVVIKSSILLDNHEPILHVITSVNDSGNFRGAVVVDFYMKSFLETLTFSNTFYTYFFDTKGYLLFSNDLTYPFWQHYLGKVAQLPIKENFLNIQKLSEFGSDETLYIGVIKKNATTSILAVIKQSLLYSSVFVILSSFFMGAILARLFNRLFITIEEKNKLVECHLAEIQEKNSVLELNEKDLKEQNTQLEKISKELDERAKALEESNSYKSRFLANMSHELRTPLNSINILSEILQTNASNTLSAKQVEQARVIHSAGEELLQLINDILDLSKIEAKMMHLNLEFSKASDIAMQLYTNFRSIAEEKKVHLEVKINQEMDSTLYSDTDKIRQILRNFISNALKFTNDGGTVSIIVDANKEGPYAVAIRVQDTGIGIAPEHQERVFNSFEQVDGGISRKYGGTGLGLAISKELSVMLQGKITLESSVDGGSTFSLLLPREIKSSNPDSNQVEFSHEEPSSIASEPINERIMVQGDDTILITEEEKSYQFNGMKVLVVDDDVRNIFALSAMLEENESITVETAFNGLEALNKLREDGGFDLVLMDIMMPVMDGYEAIREIRLDPSLKEISIIALTAKAQAEDRQQCLDAGANDYLSKPIKRDKLLNLMLYYRGNDGKSNIRA